MSIIENAPRVYVVLLNPYVDDIESSYYIHSVHATYDSADQVAGQLIREGEEHWRKTYLHPIYDGAFTEEDLPNGGEYGVRVESYRVLS